MPWEYFKAIDVAVLASTENEGIPQTLLQAMSLKTAVVATNVGGVPEIIFHEKTGLLVQPRDPQSIQLALEKILSNHALSKILVDNAFNFVAETHTWTNLGTAVEEVFSQQS